MNPGRHRNRILQHLPAQVIERLQLQKIQLPILKSIETPGDAITHVLFLEEGIASMTTALENGVQVETSMFGFESAIGISGIMGVRRSLNAIFMQFPGYGFRCTLDAAKREFSIGGPFQKLALRHVQTQLTLSMQTSACNAAHTYEQRLARWLLICSDRAQSDSLEMAQEFVAMMLGSTRSTVSIAASHLKSKGLIDYSRGVIVLLDKPELEVEACECYRVVRNHLESLAQFDSGQPD